MKPIKPKNQFTPDPNSDQTFVPAMPRPHRNYPGVMQMARSFKRDMLSIWWQAAYVHPSLSISLLGRQWYVANTPDSVKYMMVTAHDNFERKSPQMRRGLEFLLGDGLFISDGATWKFRRRAVTPVIHKNRLDRYFPTFVETANEYIKRWDDLGPKASVDMLVEMASLTAEIISRTVFGKQLGRTMALDVIEGFTAYQKSFDPVNWGYLLGANNGWPMFKGPRVRKATKKIHDVVDGVIEKHIKGEGDESSMISMLLDARDDETGQAMTPVGLRNEAITIFMAGHETTAATLSWAWYLLSQAPWAEERLYQELNDVLGNRDPTLEDVRKLHYTRAVIEETLRLYPPVPILARQAKRKDKIKGQEIKSSAIVAAIPWLLHRHRLYWQSPDNFHPERFLQDKRPIPYSYIPFATGPRICAGASFGLTEAVICLAILARRFKPRIQAGWTVEVSCAMTVKPKNGLPMTLNPRP